MKINDSLEYHYSGDENWEEWVDIHKNKWVDNEYQKKLLNILENHRDLAIGIYGVLENDSLNWIEKKIPALEDLSALDCLKNICLINRLRECLMRFPV